MAKNNNEMENHTINLIGSGTVIEGNITSTGDIRIDGNLKGNLSTKGKVIVGDTGKVNGEINCRNLEIEGILDGRVIVSELLSFRSKSKISGDITTAKLAIEPGAVFTGKCDMTAGTPTTNNVIPATAQPKEK
jgi:cytoskeletal protein CcmA (bactofilin family)